MILKNKTQFKHSEKALQTSIAQIRSSIMTLKSSYSLEEYATKCKPQVVGVTHFWHLLGDAFLSTRRAEDELLSNWLGTFGDGKKCDPWWDCFSFQKANMHCKQ